MTKDRPHELALTDSGALSPEQQAALGAIIQQLMTPVIEAMAGMMRRNSEALERLAAAQGTINYELLCQISKRIPRICHRGTETSQILQYIV